LFYIEPYLDTEKKQRVSLEFYSKSFQNKYDFSSSDSPITIGRKNCVITINSNAISKNQSTLFFENKSWFITDGFENKGSTNGTWLLLDSKHEINEPVHIKIGSNVIKIDFEN